jgi:hypothetical protein
MSEEPIDKYQYKEKLVLKNLNPNSAELRKINCPSCTTSIPADNLNIQSNIGKCDNCDGIFSFEDQVNQLSLRQDITQEILRPEGLELNYFNDELNISMKQPWSAIEISIISLFPILALMLTVLIAETVPSTPLSRAIIITMLIAALIGYIGYFFIRQRHKLHIHIDDRNMYLERRPQKFIKDKTYPINEIDQVYVKNTASGNGLFMIVNGTSGQKHIPLIHYIANRTKAKFIEQEIERQIGIDDRRVPAEGA